MPTNDEHQEAQTLYEKSLNAKINPPQPQVEEEEVKEEPIPTAEVIEQKEVVVEEATKPGKTEEDVSIESNEEEAEANTAVQEPADQEMEEEKREPTSWQDLDIKAMKVTELRNELEARGLNSKGLKTQLAGRLQKAVKQEQEEQDETVGTEEEKCEEVTEETPEKVVEEEEQQKPESTKAEDEPEIMEIDSSPKCAPPKREMKPPPKPELDEKQKQALENAYKFPGGPSILVHPHPKAKSGKFDCTVMSLSVLLDYRTEDNKESTFEVSLFAELFNEMLMRDSGFKLYRAVVEEAEKPKVVAADNAAKEDIKESDGDTNSSEPTNKKEEETKSEAADTKKKIVTKDKDLLLACSYFDLGHCGYFETKDLEDIFTTMNLNLSRAQIKKLVAKVTVGKDQQVNYRTFTDKPEDQDINVMTNDIEKLGHGFRAHVPFQEVDDSSTSSSNEGLCSYRGKTNLQSRSISSINI
jgi:hypothetical protein